MSTRAWIVFAVATTLLTACTGLMEEPRGAEHGNFGTDRDEGPELDGSSSALCTTRDVGLVPLRRLTRAQYARTIRDLLGTSIAIDELPADDSSIGYEVGNTVSPLLAEAYLTQAEALASKATLPSLLGCDPKSAGEEACAAAFIARFGRRAFRRALETTETDALINLYTSGKAALGFDGGIRLVIEAVLGSPSFLYHVEQSDPSDVANLERLAPFALANRLSYLLWGSMPDDALLDAAESNALSNEVELEQQTRRMLDARPDAVREGFREFYRQWLGLDAIDTLERDPTLFPDFSADVAGELRASLERQIDDAVWAEDGGLSALLLGQTSFVNKKVDELFGVSQASIDLAVTDLDPAKRAGILTHPALLATLSKPNQSDPVIRGKFVRERILCQELPPPPADIVIVPPDLKPGLSTRERFSAHSTDPSCSGCHKLMDPIGFAFEHYDALGRFRAEEEGKPIDARGAVTGIAELAGEFTGAVELAQKLAQSRIVSDCIATQFFRFAVARREQNADACSLERVQSHFRAKGGDLRELLVSVVRSDAFRFQKPVESTP